MIPYWTQACPSCGGTVDGGLGVAPISRLGYELAGCPKKKCGALYVTGAVEWNHMSGRQKFWYLCSLLVIGTVVICGIGYVASRDSMFLTSGATTLGVLAAGKTARIMLSKRRCPEGREELTLELQPFPRVAVALCGVTAFFTWVIVEELYPQAMWVSYAVGVAALLAAMGFTAAWLNKVMHVQEPWTEVEPTITALVPPQPENPWAGKDS